MNRRTIFVCLGVLVGIAVLACIGLVVLGAVIGPSATTVTSRTTSQSNATSVLNTTAAAIQPTVTALATVATIQALPATETPEPAIETPQPTKTPSGEVKLEVGSYTSYPSSIGGVYFVGEVINKGTLPASNVQIALSLLDTNGNVLAADSANLAELHVAPANGGKWPFRLLVEKAPQTWKEVKIQVQGEPYTGGFIFYPYLDLKVDKVTAQSPKNQFETFGVSGQIDNIGQKTATLVHVVAIAYDKNGKVVDVNDTYAQLNEIAPGNNARLCRDFSVNSATANPFQGCFWQYARNLQKGICII